MSTEENSACVCGCGDSVTKGNATVEGNLYVDGNAQVDGKVDIGGNVRVGKTLTVAGFLDAPNIRGCSKGLFLSRESLVAKYAHPHIGWWALVAGTLSSATTEATLYTCELDEYERPYWASSGATVPLGESLLTQFEDYDERFAAVDDHLAALDEQDASLSSAVSLLEDRVTVVESEAAALQGDVSSLAGAVTTLQGDVTTLQENIVSQATVLGTLQGAVQALQGDVSSVQGAVTSVQGDVAALQEDKERWDAVARQLTSGRVNNGTERFDAVYDSTVVTCTFFDEAPSDGTDWDGIAWLCDKKMFVAYKAAAVTNSTCGCVSAVWFFFYHWSTDYLYMEAVATAGGLWRDKLYMAEGHVWMWKRCDGNLSVIGAAGDYEVLTNDEIDEILEGFQFVAPTAGSLSSVSLSAAYPLVAEPTVYDGAGGATLSLSITEATEEEIDNIFNGE